MPDALAQAAAGRGGRAGPDPDRAVRLVLAQRELALPHHLERGGQGGGQHRRALAGLGE